ncbi:hypothetical protein Tco_1437466 [Tanacetum coccineum]
MHRGITWDKVENPDPQSTPQVFLSFEEYTPPVTYPEEVEETIRTLIEVEPLDETQLKDLGLNTYDHDIPLSNREVLVETKCEEPEPQPIVHLRCALPRELQNFLLKSNDDRISYDCYVNIMWVCPIVNASVLVGLLVCFDIDSSAKRAGDKLEYDKSKKQNTDENEEVEVDNEAELKKHTMTVKDDDIAIDAIPLASKPPVIGIDREDSQTLWKLVKTKYGDTRLEDEHERVLWGYSQNSKAYIILNKHTRKVEELLNVTFDETPPPSKTSPLVDDGLDEEEAIKVTEKKNLEKDIEDETLKIDKIVNIKESRNHPLQNVTGNLNQRTLRSQAQNQSNFFCFISTIEPKNVNEALSDKS